jgi:signal transduction histidine kinase/CheY-like chemotaxis protein
MAEQDRSRAADDIEIINRIGQALVGQSDLQTLVQFVTDQATTLTGAQFGAFLYKVSGEQGEAYTLYALSGAPRSAFESFRLQRQAELSGPTFSGQGIVRIDDVTKDPRYGKTAPHHGMSTGHLPVTSYLAVPVVSRFGEVFGGLIFGHEQPAVFSERVERIMAGIAAQTAIAIDNAGLIEREQRASRAKDEFLAIVSHELRTPLNAVYGWASMLRAGQLTGEAATRALDAIVRNTNVQVQLIDDLLDVSRIVTGKLRLNVEAVDIKAVVEASIETVKPSAEAKGIQLQSAFDPRAVGITGDPARLQQAVWNLLTNAVKFTPRGGQIEVELRRSHSHIEIVVSDTGQGIAHDFLPHLFERFSQSDSVITRRSSGLGLGLALVRHLIEAHGGTVSARSPGEGKGATFAVRLPLAIAKPVVDREREPRAHRGSPRHDVDGAVPPSLVGLRLLAVDDDQDSRDLIMTVLANAGAEVRVSASAAEALKIVQDWRPDVLISDIEMPGEDGYALIQKVRSLDAEGGGKVPAVALTAYGKAEDRRRSMSAGFSMHVPKPVDPTELVAIVQAATRGGRSTSAAAGGGWPANGMNSPASRVDLQNPGVAG